MRRIYLDQNMWIYLGRAYHGKARRASDTEVLELALSAVEGDHASFVLSAWNYMELLKHRNAGTRARLGQVMHLLSRMHSIAHPTVLVPGEIDAALHRWFGLPVRPDVPEVFGIGVSHAFGEPPFDLGDALELVPESERARVMEEAQVLYELSVLLGVPASMPGWEEGFQSVIDNMEEYAEAESRRTQLFHEWGKTNARLSRLVVAVGFKDILHPLLERFSKAGLSLEEFMDRGSDELTRFFSELPIASALAELKTTAYRNSEHRWQLGDLNDLSAASVSVVHCDVVAMEKHWGSALTRSGLDELHDTIVITDLHDLPEALVSGSQLER